MQNLKENWHEAWRNLVNFHAGSQMSENLYFDGLLQSKAFKVLGEKANKSYVSWHWRVMQSLKKNWLLVPKMTWRTWWTLMWAVASLKICTLMCYLSIAYKVSAKKVHQSYLSWHWRAIQTLKKNWLFVWKMTWGIWWILTQAVENLKTCTFMDYVCWKHVMFEIKKCKGVVSWKMT